MSPYTGRFWTMDTYEGRGEVPSTLHKYVYAMGNPVDNIDPTGRWGSQKFFWVHQRTVDEVLSFLPKHDRDVIKDGDAEMDDGYYQSSYFSYIHAMSSPVHTKTEARQLADEFVHNEIAYARQLEAQGSHDAALHALGRAIHTLQDSTSPAHAGFQYWDGNWSEFSFPTFLHIATETYYPEEGAGDPYGDALFKITRQAYVYFKSSKPLPSDFFWFNPPTVTLNMLRPLLTPIVDYYVGQYIP